MTTRMQMPHLPADRQIPEREGRQRGYHAPPEPALCPECGNVYAGRRWTLPTDPDIGRGATLLVCPACRAEKSGIAGGYLHLEGQFLMDHREELIRLLHNEAERAVENNPLARIMGIETDDEGRTTVKTTTEQLAQRLGRALESAFHGEVHYAFSRGNKLTHVWWQRDH
jgi:hypothetical protein